MLETRGMSVKRIVREVWREVRGNTNTRGKLAPMWPCSGGSSSSAAALKPSILLVRPVSARTHRTCASEIRAEPDQSRSDLEVCRYLEVKCVPIIHTRAFLISDTMHCCAFISHNRQDLCARQPGTDPRNQHRVGLLLDPGREGEWITMQTFVSSLA